MTGGGVFERIMRSSVDRALRMQPKRTRRMADELFYATPAARDEVQMIRDAGARLVAGGMLLPTVGAIAVRRGENRATVTVSGADLRVIDNRSLESVSMTDRRPSPALAGLRAGGRAAIHVFPPHILALAAEGETWDELAGDLSDLAGVMRTVQEIDDVCTGLTVIVGRGVVVTHDDAGAAAARIEAAEMLARTTIIRRQIRRRHG